MITASSRAAPVRFDVTSAAPAVSSVIFAAADRDACPFTRLADRARRSRRIDHLQLERFRRGQAHRFAHRLFRPFDIAPAQLREAADIGGRVVDLFAVIVPRLRLRALSFAFRGLVRWPAPGRLAARPAVPICTGVAAPRLVAGAIAAMWLA